MKRWLVVGALLLTVIAPASTTYGLDLQEATIKVAQEIKDSVVAISSLQVVRVYPDVDSMFYDLFPELFGPSQMERVGIGSGVIIDKDGYILTNEHVLGPAADILVTLPNGNEYHAKVVAVDYKADLAVIKIEPREELKVAKLGDSDKVRIGQWVMAVGNPFGVAFHSAEPTLTVGIVSAVHRSLPEGMWRGRNYVDLIQTDAAINPGNSGGPLVNMEGEVIGINVAIVSPSGGSVGLGFAIPINAARRVIESAMSGKPIAYGWIGIAGQDITSRLQRYFGLPKKEGVLVVSVVQGGPADRAGIREGDVILSFNGHPIRDLQDLLRYVGEVSPGSKVEVELLRNGRRMTLTLVVGKQGEGFVNPRVAKGKGSGGRGEEVSGPVDVKGMVLQDTGSGVVVVDVKPNSPAQRAGIKKGDKVLRINSYEIRSLSDVLEIPEEEREGNILVKTGRGYFVILD